MRVFCIFLGLTFFLCLFFPADLRAFYSSEKIIFSRGAYNFQMEVQVSGNGSLKKKLIQLSSFKVKIKNEKTRSGILKVKNIRAFSAPSVYSDIETLGFVVSPGNWVTKFYHMRRNQKPLLGEEAYIQIAFEGFTIQFNPWERKFQELP